MNVGSKVPTETLFVSTMKIVSGLFQVLILNGHLYLSDVWLGLDLITCLKIHDLKEIGLHVQHVLIIRCSNVQCNEGTIRTFVT